MATSPICGVSTGVPMVTPVIEAYAWPRAGADASLAASSLKRQMLQTARTMHLLILGR